MNRSIMIVQPRIPQYRVDYFNGIVDLLRESEITVVIVIPDKIDNSRNDEQSQLVKHFKCKSFKVNLMRLKIEYIHLDLRKHQPELIILEHAIRNLLLFLELRLRGYRVGFWGHGKNYTSAENFVVSSIKKWMALRSFFFFVYTEGGKAELLKNGLEPSKIHVMNNTISNPFKTFSPEKIFELDRQKELFLQSHRLLDKKIFIYIGAIDAGKRLDFLFDAFTRIHEYDSKSVLLVFGDGNDRKQLEKERSSTFIKFLGQASAETKYILSKIGIAILMPGRVGLIAVDSFQMSIPIITTKFRYHAPEFEYLEDGINCLISEDNLDSFESVIKNYLSDEELQIRVKTGAGKSEKNYRISTMQEGFGNKVSQLLGKGDI